MYSRPEAFWLGLALSPTPTESSADSGILHSCQVPIPTAYGSGWLAVFLWPELSSTAPAAIYALHVVRGPALIFNGLGDTVVSIPRCRRPFFEDLHHRVVELHGGPAGVFERGFAPANASHRPYFITRPVVQWLAGQIGFPNWTEDTIRSMPETKIGAWAEKTGVLVDRLYATGEREGGTLALGDDIPGYVPAMLDALPRAEWESGKKDFILETWLEAAKRNIINLGH